MRAVLYIGHGTRTKEGVQELTSFIQRVMEQSDVPIQEYCFLKLTEPPIETGFRRCVERGATEITIVPLFLLAAGHIKEDIPQALLPLRKKFPNVKVNVRNPLGVQAKILDVIEELVRKTVNNLTQRDSILIVGVGGSDPGIPANFEEIKKGIKNRLEIDDVSICYLAAAEPNLLKGLDLISKNEENRAIVIPYLFFPGQLLNVIKQHVNERKKQGLQIFTIDPLSSHRMIEHIILQSIIEASEEHLAV